MAHSTNRKGEKKMEREKMTERGKMTRTEIEQFENTKSKDEPGDHRYEAMSY